MSGFAAAVRLDVLTVRPYGRQVLLLGLAVACISVVGGPPVAVVAAGSVFAALVAAYPFAIGDKNELDSLRSVLPAARRTFVRARYAATVGMYAVCLAVCTGLALATAAARGEPVDAAELGMVAALGYALFAVLAGLQLPVYYALGYPRGRVVAYVPLIVLSAAVAASTSLLGDLAPALTAWVTARPGASVALLLVAGTGLLVASCVTARRLDARRAARGG